MAFRRPLRVRIGDITVEGRNTEDIETLLDLVKEFSGEES